jgi:hypothetical protein
VIPVETNSPGLHFAQHRITTGFEVGTGNAASSRPRTSSSSCEPCLSQSCSRAAARDRPRDYLRAGRSFAWNATMWTRMSRLLFVYDSVPGHSRDRASTHRTGYRYCMLKVTD